jgi:hypothetical protein
VSYHVSNPTSNNYSTNNTSYQTPPYGLLHAHSVPAHSPKSTIQYSQPHAAESYSNQVPLQASLSRSPSLPVQHYSNLQTSPSNIIPTSNTIPPKSPILPNNSQPPIIQNPLSTIPATLTSTNPKPPIVPSTAPKPPVQPPVVNNPVKQVQNQDCKEKQKHRLSQKQELELLFHKLQDVEKEKADLDKLNEQVKTLDEENLQLCNAVVEMEEKVKEKDELIHKLMERIKALTGRDDVVADPRPAEYVENAIPIRGALKDLLDVYSNNLDDETSQQTISNSLAEILAELDIDS